MTLYRKEDIMIPIIGKLLIEAGSMLGRIELAKLDFYASRAVKQQERNLKKLMKQNKNTVYGKLHNFKDVKTVDDYRRIVPYSSYPDYVEYIDRMANNGEKNLITAKHVARYAESSGSTGQSKLVPMSDWASWVCQCFTFSAPIGCAYKHFKSKGMAMPPQKGLLTIEVLHHKTPSGQTAAGLAAHPMLFVKPLTRFFVTSPKEVMYPATREPMDMHYMKLRYALMCEDVSYLSTVFITMLEAMFFYMEQNWEMLCDDIEKGIINESIVCPPDVRKKLEKKLKPMPERAEALRREFRKGFDDEAIVPRIWPKCGWLYGMGTGSLSLYSKKLRRYVGPDIPMHYLGYAASEGLMAVPTELNSHEYVLLPQNGFFEFLPLDAPEGTKTLTISELEIGKEYEIIVTNMSGFYRYRIEDVVKVTGFYKQSPKVTFLYRLNQIANISGEKINQHAFDLLINDLCEATGEEFNGYCIYADRSTSPGHYCLLIEPKNDVPDSECARYAEIFEKRLCETNVLVMPQIRNGALGHCEVKFLKNGTYSDYRETKGRQGANLNQLKPVKVIDNDERYEFFFGHVRDSLK